MLTLDWGNRLRAGKWLLLAMLGLLHAVLLFGVNNPLAHALLLAHLGLFLIWQPLWRGEREVGGGALISIVLAAAMSLFWLSWWSIAFWLTGLFGLVGARVFVYRDTTSRLLYLSVTAYLLAVLLLWVVPNLFAAQSTIEVGHALMWYVFPILLLAMAVLPVRNEPVDNLQAVDFIYSLLLFMLLTLVVLGSLAFMTLGRLDYLEALLRTLFLIALVLLALGGLWNPRFGFSGLQVMFSRYLLNVGTPFENWLTRLAEAAQRESDSAAYLRRAIALLEDLPWLSGLSWHSPDGAGQIGQANKHDVQVHVGELSMTLYARQSLNPSVRLHIHLLTRLIGYFYQAKQHEQSLRDITRLQAVYETGSRLTHDMKNMLQSLLSLTSLAQSREQKAQQLLLQQLPLLTKRIQMILNKLQQSQSSDQTQQAALREWWDAAQQRNQFQIIKWQAPKDLADHSIPAAMFDCVLENLLDNALIKRRSQPDITITVELHIETHSSAGDNQKASLWLTVSDSGDRMSERIAEKLMRGVVDSENGFGVGLYQAARWARQFGFRLMLVSNEAGNVCFELRHL